MVRATGIEPAQALRPYEFSNYFGFHRRREATIPSPRRVSAAPVVWVEPYETHHRHEMQLMGIASLHLSYALFAPWE
jgi:hypothetical protein